MPTEKLLLLTLSLLLIAGSVSAQADVELISQGREVILEEHLVPGKLVLFDFFADWCAPCRQLTPRLERLAAQYPDQIALRKVDVLQWDSPVSRQYGVPSLPYLVLYGADGARLAAGDPSRVLRVLGEQLGGTPGGFKKAAGRSRVPGTVWVTLIVALVAGSLALRVRARRGDTEPGRAPAPVPLAGHPSPSIWFVLRPGGVDGPHSVEQLETLYRSGDLAADAKVRRRGESSWRRLRDVVGRN